MGIVVARETKEHFTQAVLFELCNNRTFSGNGYFYRGQMLGFDPHGYGQMWFENGDKYEGQFDCGLFDGTGTMSFTNGDLYKGGSAGPLSLPLPLAMTGGRVVASRLVS